MISIVIPAHNAGRFLAQTLESIRSQTVDYWQAVVVDDGSTDDTRAVAESFAARDDRIRVISQQRGGAAAARNTGFRASDASCDYVTFMDSDDVWLPEALETLIGAARAHPDMIGSHGLAEFIDQDGLLFDEGAYAAHGRNRLGLTGGRLVRWPLDRPTAFAILINGNVLFPPGLLLVRREAYLAAGPFDEGFSGPEDWDMLIRLSRLGDIAFVDRVILHYRRHQSNLGAGADVARQAWLVRCKAFHSPENDAAQRRIARRGWRAYQRMLVIEARRRVKVSLRERSFRSGVADLMRIGVFGVRWLRGYPLPRVRSKPLSW